VHNSQYVLATCLLLAGCKSTNYDPNQPRILADDRADATEYKDLFTGAVNDLVSKTTSVAANQGMLKIAIMTVKTTSREELGPERRGFLQDRLVNDFSDMGHFAVIDREMVKVALNAVGIASEEELLLPDRRNKFVEILQQQGQAPSYVLFPAISSIGAKSESLLGSQKQMTYSVNLRLVNTRTGEVTVGRGEVVKSYTSGLIL